MAEDVMEASYTEEELWKKYGNFFAPAAKILIGDAKEDLSEQYQIQFEDIRVTLSRKESSGASFTLTNVYDVEKRSIRESVADVICPGNKVQIALGYTSEFTVVFSGYIQEVSVQFGEVPGMQVAAADVRRLMSENNRENYAWGHKKHSDLFTALMEDYKELASVAGNVDATSTELHKPLIQKGSDLNMVYELCQAANRSFYVCGDKAYWKETTTESPAAVLSFGQSLISFSKAPVYVDVLIEVWGNLKGTDEKLVETRSVSAEGTIKHVCGNGGRKIIVLTDIESSDELTARADKEEKALKKEAKAGSGSCVGIPVLFPGRFVKIEGLGADINGTYFLESVTHSFGSGGYTTDFTVGKEDAGFYGGVLDGEKEKNEKARTVQGVMKGKVINNWDSEHPGMVEIELVMGEKENNNIGWVPVAASYAGNEFGAYALPEIGSYVLLAFDLGRLESPYVIGCFWNQTTVLPKETANEKNTTKTFLTKGGNRILVSDEEGKERIALLTKGELSVLLEDETQKISIQSGDGKNALQIDAKEGVVTLGAAKKAVFQINGKDMLTLDGTASNVKLAADSISVEAAQKLSLKGKGAAKVESSGSIELKGTAVKLN